MAVKIDFKFLSLSKCCITIKENNMKNKNIYTHIYITE